MQHVQYKSFNIHMDLMNIQYTSHSVAIECHHCFLASVLCSSVTALFTTHRKRMSPTWSSLYQSGHVTIFEYLYKSLAYCLSVSIHRAFCGWVGGSMSRCMGSVGGSVVEFVSECVGAWSSGAPGWYSVGALQGITLWWCCFSLKRCWKGAIHLLV